LTGLPETGDSAIFHASCVAVAGRGLLILGPSGAGKSALALRMMALGARLVSDDRVLVTREAGLMARCPSPAIRGLIEARGVGLLRADPLDEVPLALVADLGQVEAQRLPPHRTITILGMSLPLVLQVQNDHFPAAMMVYLHGGRQD
jgi:HPr kinase/phosphorylase